MNRTTNPYLRWRCTKLVAVALAVVMLALGLHHVLPCDTHGVERNGDLCPLCTLLGTIVLVILGTLVFGALPKREAFRRPRPVTVHNPALWATWARRGPPLNLLCLD